jgi:3-hydroxyacyl-CoA dehydrogenase
MAVERIKMLTFRAEVTTSKDVPGFVSNALLMPFINEVQFLICLKDSL